MATSTTFDASPKPKISMTSGRIALLGIGYVAEIIGFSAALARRVEGGMGVRGPSRSDAWDMRGGLLRFRLQHFLAKQSPQMVDESPVRRVGPHFVGLAGARKRNLYHSLDPSRGGRHNEDAVCEHDGLVDAVRDEDPRLAVLVPDLNEFCLQQDARLFVKLAERLVHEQHFGVCGKRAGNAGPLFHPSGP